MPSLDQYEAFITAAEQGSFSAAARKLGKAQSAISNAVINLELETNLQLFDRSQRSPQLTLSGKALLPEAKAILRSQQEFIAKASSFSEGVENQLSIAIEESVPYQPFLSVLLEFGERFPYVELELLGPSLNDVTALIRDDRVHIGLMLTQEFYPEQLMFKSLGHTRLWPVCHVEHPLAKTKNITLHQLRQHRQFATSGRDGTMYDAQDLYSSKLWRFEGPYMILDFILNKVGWAFLPEMVIQPALKDKKIAIMDFSFLDKGMLECVDLVWTHNKSLGKAGQWLLKNLMQVKLDQY